MKIEKEPESERKRQTARDKKRHLKEEKDGEKVRQSECIPDPPLSARTVDRRRKQSLARLCPGNQLMYSEI